ncbi:MAG: DUF6090 family protein [Balneolaceae bacterium]
MFRFFRILRKKLLEDGYLNKYFWYAIGEVILVVIGILIALQINNWNVERQVRNEEITYLKNLKADLQKDIQLLNDNIDYTTDNVESTARLTTMSEQGEVEDLYAFIDDILIVMLSMNFTPNQNTFQEMRSSGKLSIISNEMIKQRLLELDEQYIRIEGGESHVKREYEIYLWDEFVNVISWRDYYDLDELRTTTEIIVDRNYVEAYKEELRDQAEEILANKRFQNGLYLYEFNYRFIRTQFEGAINSINQLIELIDEEIAN